MVMDSIEAGKVSLIVTVGFFTLAASGLPWFFQRCLSRSKVVDAIWISCALAAGVVTGAFLSHILPDANDAFDTYFDLQYPSSDDPNHGAPYPFAPLICGAAFALLVFIDKAASGSLEEHGHSHVGLVNSFPAQEKEQPEFEPIASAQLSPLNIDPKEQAASTIEEQPQELELSEVAKPPVVSVVVDTVQDVSSEESDPKPVDIIEQVLPPTAAVVARAYIFFGALSVHSIFDGLAIGTQNEQTGFDNSIAAVVGHKAFDGISLGVAIYFAKLTNFHTILLLVLCSAMTPVGIIVAMVATDATTGAAHALAEGTILGLSAGSFLFIALVELLPSSLADGRRVKSKLVAFGFGWAVMAAVAIVS